MIRIRHCFASAVVHSAPAAIGVPDSLRGSAHAPAQGVIALSGRSFRCACSCQRAGDTVSFAFFVEKRGAGLPPKLAPEWYYRDHVVFFLDPRHDHEERCMLAVTRDGEIVTSRERLLPGEACGETWRGALEPLPAERVEVKTTTGSDGWGGIARIRFPALHPLVTGLRIKVCAGAETWFTDDGEVGEHAQAQWPPAPPTVFCDLPFAFGDLLAGPRVLPVARIDFGEPRWGTNRLRVEAARAWRRTRVTVDFPGACCQEFFSGRDPGEVVYELPFRGKWSPGHKRMLRLRLDCLDLAGQAAWSGSWPVSFDHGVIAREAFGQSAHGRAERPAPDDPFFLERYREFLLARLPDLARRTTREGAPSDFCVVDEAAGVSFDLMDPRVFKSMAGCVHERFDDWRDGLCAATMLLHSRALTVHSGLLSPLAGRLDAAGALRVLGCFCHTDAMILHALCCELGMRYGLELRGWRLGLRGHVVLALRTPDGVNVFDSMLGAFYYTRDNRRFATLRELQQERDLAYRMSFDQEANGHEMFFGNERVILQEFPAAGARFPAMPWYSTSE